MTKAYIPAALALTLLVTGPALSEEAKEKQAAPITAEAAANLAGDPIQGKVLEVRSAGGYTYLLLENQQGTLWTAVPESKVEAGQEVIVSPGMLMKSFESKALGKKFDVIIFSSGLTEAGDIGQAATAAGKNPHASGAMNTPVSDTELEKLSGGSARAVVPADDPELRDRLVRPALVRTGTSGLLLAEIRWRLHQLADHRADRHRADPDHRLHGSLCAGPVRLHGPGYGLAQHPDGPHGAASGVASSGFWAVEQRILHR